MLMWLLFRNSGLMNYEYKQMKHRGTVCVHYSNLSKNTENVQINRTMLGPFTYSLLLVSTLVLFARHIYAFLP